MAETAVISCAADLDDGHERSDNTVVVDSPGELHASDFGAFTIMGLMRFPSLAIPSGSVILTAVVKVKPNDAAEDDADFTISCEDVDDCPAVVVTNGNISSRTLTTANATWVASALGTTPLNSPDFTSAVQEVIDRVGWASGNAIGVVFHSAQNAQVVHFEPYNAAGTDEPELTVTYLPPGQLIASHQAGVSQPLQISTPAIAY